MKTRYLVAYRDAYNGWWHENCGKAGADDDSEHTCPICGEPISRNAVGCRKHWREVRKQMAAR
jgi:rubrerythrin